MSSAAPSPILRLQGLHKRFGDLHVLRGIDLDVQPGERIAIIGSSGSGKSTMLRCINFMEMPSAGRIEIQGKAIGTPGRPLPDGTVPVQYAQSQLSAVRRSVGMVFQQFNLFPHMTVVQNVMEGPVTVKGEPREAAHAKALRQLDKVGLANKADVYPGRLSGGQQQRVAIARALAMEPQVLLFDEPTSWNTPSAMKMTLVAK